MCYVLVAYLVTSQVVISIFRHSLLHCLLSVIRRINLAFIIYHEHVCKQSKLDWIFSGPADEFQSGQSKTMLLALVGDKADAPAGVVGRTHVLGSARFLFSL